MSHIGIDSNDLTLLARDINDISTKITSLQEAVNSKFDTVKELNVYDKGFDSINKYLEQELSTLTDVKAKIEKYQNDVMGIEKAFGEKFNNIVVPKVVGNSTNLVVINPATLTQSYNSPSETEFFKDTNVVEEKKDSNVLGVLAGAAGVVGAGGLAAAAYVKSREDKEEKEKEEEKPQEDQQRIEKEERLKNILDNIAKEY